MDGLGRRLKARARALGWSDAEVARRLDIAQTRYANYVTDKHEPDLATFLRICRVLGAEPEALLGYEPTQGRGEAARMRRRIAALGQAMDEETLRLALELMELLAARSARQKRPGRSASRPRGKPSP